MAYKEFPNIGSKFQLPTEIPEEHRYFDEAKRWKRKIEAETKRLALAGKVFASGMSGYDAWIYNLKYYSKGGTGYAQALKDYKLGYAQEYTKKYNLGITGAQLLTNPQLASDPRALAEYTGRPYGGVDYTPGSADWYKLHPEEVPKKGEVKPPFSVHPSFGTTPTPLWTTQGFGQSSYTGVSIVDYLKSVGQPSDYASRSVLAEQQGITDYAGTAEQNTQLLGILRGTPSITPQPITPASISPTTPTDVTKAPIVPSNVAGLQAQIASVQEQIAGKTKELEAARTAEAAPPPPKWWETLGKKQEVTQAAITKSQQDLLAQQEAIYERWGLTPEKYQQVQDLTTQITAYQKQIADLDTREAQAIEAIQGRPGIDLAFASGETARIQRAYAIQRSGIAANASVLAAQAQAMQGNWDNAFKSAQLYVDNATLAQQQYVSDLRWGYDNFSDLIQAMAADERQRINDQLDYETDILKMQQTDYWKQIDADFKAQGLELGWYKATQERIKAPTTREIDGKLHEWDPDTGTWIPAEVTVPTDIPAPPDYISSFQSYKTAGWSREQVENSWIAQYNATVSAANQIKDRKEMNRQFPEIKASLDEVYEPSKKIGLFSPETLSEWWKGIWGK